MAAAITGGELTLSGVPSDMLEAVFKTLSKAGLILEDTPRGTRVSLDPGELRGVDVMTELSRGSRPTCRHSSWP